MNKCLYTYTRKKRKYAYIYMRQKKHNIGNTTPMKPDNMWSEACCRLFIENEVRIIEKDIERRLGNQLKKLGCIYMKFVSPGNDGVPDRIVVLPGGGVIFIELKATTGKLMANQRVQISRLRKQGALVFVLTGKRDAELFVDYIERVIHGLSSTRVPRDCYSADS